MALTPFFATSLGWPSAFRLFAIVGLIWAVSFSAPIPECSKLRTMHKVIPITYRIMGQAAQIQCPVPPARNPTSVVCQDTEMRENLGRTAAARVALGKDACQEISGLPHDLE